MLQSPLPSALSRRPADLSVPALRPADVNFLLLLGPRILTFNDFLLKVALNPGSPPVSFPECYFLHFLAKTVIYRLSALFCCFAQK